MNKSIYITLFFFLILSFFTTGKTQSIEECKSYRNEYINVVYKELLDSIAQNNISTFEKAKALFLWITANIRYDSLGYKTGFWDNYTSTIDLANDTYIKRKGICSGYSYLFKYFCNELNIECEVINGYSRTEFTKAGLPFEKTNHSWNIIKLNDKWQYVDATWGYATAKTKSFKLYYFLTPYDEFESNHFPQDDRWLLSKNMTKETFNSLPYISFEYFRSTLYNGKYPIDGLLKAKGDSVIIILPDTKDKPKILIRLLDYNNRKWMPPTYSSLLKDDDLQINIKKLNKGKFLLRVDLFAESDTVANIKRGLVYFTLLNE